MLFLKLNLYAFLIGAISSLFMGLSFVFYSGNHFVCLFFSGIAGLYCLHKMILIFGMYPEKRKAYHRLLEKNKDKFNKRYFLVYMDTACMRHVVYFSLLKLHKSNEYRVIKMAWKEKRVEPRKIFRTVIKEDGTSQKQYRDFSRDLWIDVTGDEDEFE